jgi:AmmeMemoRadiSam system protein B
MNPNEPLPAARPLEVTPFRHEGDEVYFALRDPTGIAAQPIAMSAAGYYVVTRLNGETTLGEIQADFAAQTGMRLPDEQVASLVSTLDEALLLDTPRFQAAYEQVCDAYRAAPTRDCRERYPDAAELRQSLRRMIAQGIATDVADVRGVIAPHLDYERGTPCYGDAYATLAAAGLADRYVILGTNHSGVSLSAVATTKDFETALGRVPTDRGFLNALERRLDTSLCQHEPDHRNEHSIELQLHILQVLHGERPFSILPILCPDGCGPTGTVPFDGEGVDLADLAQALHEVIAADQRRTVIIAAADLSHIGQHFGDEEPATPERLRAVESADREALKLLAGGDATGFVRLLQQEHNATRVCSSGCLYTLRAALPDGECRILRYHQAIDHEHDMHVTCAAGVVIGI